MRPQDGSSCVPNVINQRGVFRADQKQVKSSSYHDKLLGFSSQEQLPLMRGNA
jgi:hypothetical protein